MDIRRISKFAGIFRLVVLASVPVNVFGQQVAVGEVVPGVSFRGREAYLLFDPAMGYFLGNDPTRSIDKQTTARLGQDPASAALKIEQMGAPRHATPDPIASTPAEDPRLVGMYGKIRDNAEPLAKALKDYMVKKVKSKDKHADIMRHHMKQMAAQVINDACIEVQNELLSDPDEIENIKFLVMERVLKHARYACEKWGETPPNLSDLVYV